ncbi:MAG: cytochrome c biogenesis heme-transporting ATPase CcmA [Enterobacteriaceae bacterium]
MLQAQALCCVRGERTLFEQLSFTISPGECVQISGRNGSGKTSLLRILAGLTQPQQGKVCWQGTPLTRCRSDYQHNLLYLGHQPGTKGVLTASENLQLYSDNTLSLQQKEEQIYTALAHAGLSGYEDLPASQLSAGQQRRVALARLWLSRASLWILDEPLTAIDQTGITHLCQLFARHSEAGGMVIITSHQPIDSMSDLLRHIHLGHQ